MPRIVLTDAWLKSAPIPERGQTLWSDKTSLPRGRTLNLLIGATGSKGWRVTYYQQGRPRSARLGFYAPGVVGHMSLHAARDAAAAFKPPSAEEVSAQPSSPTLRTVVDDYLRRHVAGLRTAYDIRRRLTVHVLPKLGDKPFTAVGRSEVADLLDAVEDAHGAIVADSVGSVLRSLMAWFADRSTAPDAYSPPRIKRRRPPGRRKRILNDNEIRALWQATADLSPYSALVRFLLLTGARRAKALGLQHTDIVGNVWTIRSEPREKPNAEKLVLPQAVHAIVASQPRIEGNPYVFVGGAGPILDLHRSKARLDAKLHGLLPEMQPWVIHDLRRSARSLMSRAGVISEHAEAVLGHVLPGVEGTYNRYDFAEPKAVALQKLSDLISDILDPQAASNVVPLVRR